MTLSRLACLGGVVAALGLAAAATSNADTSSETKITMAAIGSSGESGTARIVPLGDKTEIAIQIDKAPTGVVQPAHVHAAPVQSSTRRRSIRSIRWSMGTRPPCSTCP